MDFVVNRWTAMSMLRNANGSPPASLLQDRGKAPSPGKQQEKGLRLGLRLQPVRMNSRLQAANQALSSISAARLGAMAVAGRIDLIVQDLMAAKAPSADRLALQIQAQSDLQTLVATTSQSVNGSVLLQAGGQVWLPLGNEAGGTMIQAKPMDVAPDDSFDALSSSGGTTESTTQVTQEEAAALAATATAAAAEAEILQASAAQAEAELATATTAAVQTQATLAGATTAEATAVASLAAATTTKIAADAAVAAATTAAGPAPAKADVFANNWDGLQSYKFDVGYDLLDTSFERRVRLTYRDAGGTSRTVTTSIPQSSPTNSEVVAALQANTALASAGMSARLSSEGEVEINTSASVAAGYQFDIDGAIVYEKRGLLGWSTFDLLGATGGQGQQLQATVKAGAVLENGSTFEATYRVQGTVQTARFMVADAASGTRLSTGNGIDTFAISASALSGTAAQRAAEIARAADAVAGIGAMASGSTITFGRDGSSSTGGGSTDGVLTFLPTAKAATTASATQVQAATDAATAAAQATSAYAAAQATLALAQADADAAAAELAAASTTYAAADAAAAGAALTASEAAAAAAQAAGSAQPGLTDAQIDAMLVRLAQMKESALGTANHFATLEQSALGVRNATALQLRNQTPAVVGQPYEVAAAQDRDTAGGAIIPGPRQGWEQTALAPKVPRFLPMPPPPPAMAQGKDGAPASLDMLMAQRNAGLAYQTKIMNSPAAGMHAITVWTVSEGSIDASLAAFGAAIAPSGRVNSAGAIISSNWLNLVSQAMGTAMPGQAVNKAGSPSSGYSMTLTALSTESTATLNPMLTRHLFGKG